MLSGFASQGLGKYEQSIESARKAIELDPDFIYGYGNPAFSYLYTNRLEEAEDTARRASKRGLDSSELTILRYYIAFLKDDKGGIDREMARAKGQPDAENLLLHSRALSLARSGHLRQARETSRRAAEMAQQAGSRESAAVYKTAAAIWEALFENAAPARREATEALDLSQGRDAAYGAAFALALAKDIPRAQTLANDLEKRFPEDTSVQFTYLPTLRAMFALNRGDPARAIEQLQTASRYELAMSGTNFDFFFGGLYSAYVRGNSYLALHQGAEAAVEFQKILDHSGIVFCDPIGALAHLQLGRAYAMSGEKSKARTAYQDFLTLWKDADPSIPILVHAKTEYMNLH